MSSAVSVRFVALCLGAAACSSSTSTSPPAGSDAGAASADGGNKGSDAGGSTDTGAASDAAAGSTALSGTLGALGAVQPTVSSLFISNSGETLIYLSSGPITCDLLTRSRWLGSATPGSQVVEIVVHGAPAIGTINVPPHEVNYAAGGKSSSYEVAANSGGITFTKAEASSVVEGTVNAAYDSGTLTGSFHAEFCAGGQGY